MATRRVKQSMSWLGAAYGLVLLFLILGILYGTVFRHAPRSFQRTASVIVLLYILTFSTNRMAELAIGYNESGVDDDDDESVERVGGEEKAGEEAAAAARHAKKRRSLYYYIFNALHYYWVPLIPLVTFLPDEVIRPWIETRPWAVAAAAVVAAVALYYLLCHTPYIGSFFTISDRNDREVASENSNVIGTAIAGPISSYFMVYWFAIFIFFPLVFDCNSQVEGDDYDKSVESMRAVLPCAAAVASNGLQVVVAAPIFSFESIPRALCFVTKDSSELRYLLYKSALLSLIFSALWFSLVVATFIAHLLLRTPLRPLLRLFYAFIYTIRSIIEIPIYATIVFRLFAYDCGGAVLFNVYSVDMSDKFVADNLIIRHASICIDSLLSGFTNGFSYIPQFESYACKILETMLNI